MLSLILLNVKEWLRLKFFHTVLIIAFLFICFSYLLSQLSFTQNQRLIIDFGLAGIEFISLFLAAFLGSHILYKEIERKTILLILARPIPRWYLITSYLGSLCILNFILIAVLALSLFFFVGFQLSLLNIILSLVVIFFKSLVVGSFALFCGCFLRPMIGFILSVTYWILTYSMEEIIFFVKQLKSDELMNLTQFLSKAVPPFYLFNWKNAQFVNSGPESGLEIFWVLFQCGFWIFLYLFLASFIFRKKEIA